MPYLGNYTNNFHPNPSFQNGLAGVAVKTAETVVNLDVTKILYGTSSALVTCPGKDAGEGVITGSATIPVNCTGSVSCHVTGTGNITAYVYADGNVVGVQHITLTESWNRVIIQDIAFFGGNVVELHLEATRVESCQFHYTGCQVEDTSPCRPYCDGDQDGCYWNSGYYGISYCLYQNPIKTTSIQHSATHLVNVLDVGEVFVADPLPAVEKTYNPVVYIGAVGPKGAVTDFSVALYSEIDPAYSYVSWNNTGMTMSGSWQQSWATWIPPKDYMVSNGELLYKKAAYMAAGWEFESAAENNFAQLTNAYVGIIPIVNGNVPPVYETPRKLHSIIVANRINFVTNPSFEVSTANWSAIGSATLATDSSVTVGEIAVYDETILTAGSHSCNVTINAPGDGASISIADLLPGFNYTASAYVKAGPGLSDILMTIGTGSTSVESTGGTGYNFGAYNAGPYGGFDPVGDVPTTQWFRIWCSFTASGDSETLEILSSAAADISYPTHMWIDAVLVEQGEILQPYFDGSLGNNYSWDSASGSPGLARSYYYDQMLVRQQAVTNALTRHTPLGISYATPLYSVPPIEA